MSPKLDAVLEFVIDHDISYFLKLKRSLRLSRINLCEGLIHLNSRLVTCAVSPAKQNSAQNKVFEKIRFMTL